MANTDPCDLLTSDGKSRLGVAGGEESNLGSSRGCKWRLRGPSETYIFTAAIYDDLGIKDLPGDNDVKQLPKVGSHEAVQRTDPADPGVCAVILGVTESSRVTAQVVAGTDADKACGLAMQLAKLVEPELP